MPEAESVRAVVDYRAEARAGGHLLDVAARSEAGGMLRVELTVSDGLGEVVGAGTLRLPAAVLPPAEQVLGQVLRGLAQLHAPSPGPAPAAGDPRRAPRPNASRSWTEDEQQRLRAAWTAGVPVARIAAAHGRSANAIQSRLLKLALIPLDHPESPARSPDPAPAAPATAD